MQKSREALADGRKSIWKRIENKQWTYCSSFTSKTWFYSLVPFYCCCCFFFLIKNFIIHFFLIFITVTDLKILTTMLIPGMTLIKNGSSFPSPRLLRATRLFGLLYLWLLNASLLQLYMLDPRQSSEWFYEIGSVLLSFRVISWYWIIRFLWISA